LTSASVWQHRLAHPGASEESHALALAHRQEGVNGAHPKGERPGHPPTGERVGRGPINCPLLGRTRDAPSPITRLTQTVQHTAKHPLPDPHAEWPARRAHHRVRADPRHFPERHEHHFVAAKTDHLGLQSRKFRPAQPRHCLAVEIDQLAHAHARDGRAHN
jgi:hypothetical protein